MLSSPDGSLTTTNPTLGVIKLSPFVTFSCISTCAHRIGVRCQSVKVCE